MSEDQDKLDALLSIDGCRDIECLVEVLRRGEADAHTQKRLADALDPNGDSVLYLEKRDRTRGRGIKATISRLRAGRDRLKAAAYVRAAVARGVKQEAAVEAACQRYGVRRATVMKALSKSKNKV